MEQICRNCKSYHIGAVRNTCLNDEAVSEAGISIEFFKPSPNFGCRFFEQKEKKTKVYRKGKVKIHYDRSVLPPNMIVPHLGCDNIKEVPIGIRDQYGVIIESVEVEVDDE